MRFRFRNFLTRDEIKLLEEASEKKFKPKNPAQKYRCRECRYAWLYKATKCPVCSSPKTVKA